MRAHLQIWESTNSPVQMKISSIRPDHLTHYLLTKALNKSIWVNTHLKCIFSHLFKFTRTISNCLFGIVIDGVILDETEEYASCLSSCHDEDENNSQRNEPEDHLDDMYIGMSALDILINNKPSKKIYKAVAKELGITCQMSEQCRCDDCQGNYFNSDYNLGYNEV